MSAIADSQLETGRRISVLDGWRGISIALVLIGHFFPNSIVILSSWGVEWFFVLSGRLMAEILFVRQAPLREFYRRRLSRILPVVIVFVPVMFIAFYRTEWHFKLSAVLTALTFTINYASVFVGHQVPVIAHLWSLCIEEHTYIMLGLLAFAARRYHWKVLPTLYVAALLSILDLLISSSVPHANVFDVIWRTDAHLYAILLGSIAYLTVQQRPNAPSSSATPAVAIVVALLMQIINHDLQQEIMNVLSTIALAVAVATLESSSAPLNRIMDNTLLRRLGIMSFSIYIWQQPFYWIAQETRVNLPVKIALLCAALLTGVISFYFLEQPARRWLNQLRLDNPLTRSLPLPANVIEVETATTQVYSGKVARTTRPLP